MQEAIKQIFNAASATDFVLLTASATLIAATVTAVSQWILQRMKAKADRRHSALVSRRERRLKLIAPFVEAVDTSYHKRGMDYVHAATGNRYRNATDKVDENPELHPSFPLKELFPAVSEAIDQFIVAEQDFDYVLFSLDLADFGMQLDRLNEQAATANQRFSKMLGDAGVATDEAAPLAHTRASNPAEELATLRAKLSGLANAWRKLHTAIDEELFAS